MDSEKLTNKVMLCLNDEDHDYLKSLAKKYKCGKSTVVRKIIKLHREEAEKLVGD